MNHYKLGKRPARPRPLRHLPLFRNFFFAEALPTPPAVFGHENVEAGDGWGMFGNDEWGDCVWAGAAHEHMLLTRAGGGTPASFDNKSVLSDYAAATGFNYTDATDQGTDIGDAMKYRLTTGVLDSSGARHKIAGTPLDLRVGDFNELMLATYLFGAVGIGVNLPSNAEQQFDDNQAWDGPTGNVGGHYVCVFGRNANGNGVAVSWGRTQEFTPEWYKQVNDESVAYFCPEYVDSTKFSPEGFDGIKLGLFLKELAS